MQNLLKRYFNGKLLQENICHPLDIYVYMQDNLQIDNTFKFEHLDKIWVFEVSPKKIIVKVDGKQCASSRKNNIRFHTNMSITHKLFVVNTLTHLDEHL